MSTTSELAAVLLLAVLVEMLVEYFVQPLLPARREPPAPWWATVPYARYAAAVAGVGLCLVYRLDLLAILVPSLRPGPSPLVASYAGMVLTGLLISRGANYLHDWLANPLFDRLGAARRGE